MTVKIIPERRINICDKCEKQYLPSRLEYYGQIKFSIETKSWSNRGNTIAHIDLCKDCTDKFDKVLTRFLPKYNGK